MVNLYLFILTAPGEEWIYMNTKWHILPLCLYSDLLSLCSYTYTYEGHCATLGKSMSWKNKSFELADFLISFQFYIPCLYDFLYTRMNSRFYKLWNENHLLYLAPSSAATAFSKQFRVGFPERLYSKPWRKAVRVHPKRFKFIIRVLICTSPQLP